MTTTNTFGKLYLALNNFAERFPYSATNWGQATGELAEIHAFMAECINEQSGNELYQSHTGYSKTPAQSNARHREGIFKILPELNEQYQQRVLDQFSVWFRN